MTQSSGLEGLNQVPKQDKMAGTVSIPRPTTVIKPSEFKDMVTAIQGMSQTLGTVLHEQRCAVSATVTPSTSSSGACNFVKNNDDKALL